MGLTVCPTCNGASRIGSRIPDDVIQKCRRNGHNTCCACDKLSKIDRKIEETRRVLASLLDEREGTASMLNESHDPFIKTLPTEVVTRIFEYSLPLPNTNPYTLTYKRDYRTPVLRTLGLVSKHWLNISLGTPSLWTQLSVCVLPTNCLHAIEKFKKLLDRSASLPLRLQLFAQEEEAEQLNDTVSRSLQKIARYSSAHAGRWKSIDINVPLEIAQRVSVDFTRYPMPQLDELSVNVDVADFEGRIFEFKASPRSLSLSCLWTSVVVHYDQLTHFSSTWTMTRTHCVKLFREAPRLLECRFADVPDEDNNIMTPQPSSFIHSELHHLSIEYDFELWPLATFPSLTTLKLLSLEDDDVPVFLEFLARSRCKIQELSLESYLEPANHLAILKELPQLIKLSLRHNHQPSAVLFSLMDAEVTAEESKFLADLTSIHCTLWDLISEDWPDVIMFLHTMTTRPTKKLQKVSITCAHTHGIDNRIELSSPTADDLGLLLQVTRDIDFSIVGHDNTDILDKFRRYHDL